MIPELGQCKTQKFLKLFPPVLRVVALAFSPSFLLTVVVAITLDLLIALKRPMLSSDRWAEEKPHLSEGLLAWSWGVIPLLMALPRSTRTLCEIPERLSYF